MFILAADGRDELPFKGFSRYQEYLEANRAIFPPSAFKIATSGWYFDPRDRRCPHDAWLESVEMQELFVGVRREMRTVQLRIRLLGAWHDRYIELRYPTVLSYSMTVGEAGKGHGDWRYDELRLSDRGTLIHEIEWRRDAAVGRDCWLIEAMDLELEVQDLKQM